MHPPVICFILCLSSSFAFALDPAQTIKVWPEGVPGPINDTGPERILPVAPGTKQVMRVEGVTDPTLLYYPAPKEKACGTAIVICPGGGFSKVVPDLEGSEVAENVNALGVSAFVLKYRTSPAKAADPQLGPAMDAQRSVSIVRSRAAEFGLKPDRIGLLGISAGGQVALIAATNHAHRIYEAKGGVDQTSCRPDFVALVYPWKIQDANDLSKLRDDIRVDATTPPVFVAHAVDDPGAKVEGSLLLLLQLRRHKIPVEAHLYAKGGHGFGLRPAAVPGPTDWPQRFAQWLGVSGFLERVQP
ncbi:MAG TPA: alpha/beta hydrolase [Verrucomicrobiaceae bacterium]|jgi:acetyl esterase/lipase